MRLLNPSDPPAFTQIKAKKPKPMLLICDHASNNITESLENLNLKPSDLARHIAYDIGTKEIALGLAKTLDIEAIIANYSRLVVDLNRPLDDPTSIREIYDHCLIKGNQKLSQHHIKARHDEVFYPYHQAINDFITPFKAHESAGCVFISIHSFTPSLKQRHEEDSYQRPWHIGILSHNDRRLAEYAFAYFMQHHPELVIGDNLPYSGKDTYDYSLSTHAFPYGFANLLLEIRQDLIQTAQGQAKMIAILTPLLAEIKQQSHFFTALKGDR